MSTMGTTAGGAGLRTGSAGGARGSTPRRAAAKEHVYVWEGRDRAGKVLRGEMRASGPTVVQTTLRRQGISMTKATKRRYKRG
ncbi:MAG TPA: type II secretion system F family protein, partial [Zeimonas sp.]|nr:type II secretion system F family protein [Zeimonas sp.]